MASREHQGLQIALIVFSVLTVLTGATAILYFKWYGEAVQQAQTATKNAQDAQSAKASAETQYAEMRRRAGFGADLNEKQIDDAYKADLAKFAQNFPSVTLADDQKNYRHLVEFLHAEVRNSKKLLVDAADREKTLQASLVQLEADKKQEIKKYTDEIAKVGKDLADERDKFNKQFADLKKTGSDVAAKLDARRKEFDDREKKAQSDLDERDREIRNLDKINRDINEKIAQSVETAELLDGKVTWVNQKSRIVWLNRGTADGLTRQVAFEVIPADENNPALAVKENRAKGKIEVTRLIDRHLAEARVVEDKPENPIMPGDQIYSAVWQPGQKERFALMGFMDIDGDSQSDYQAVVDLIETSGGSIDAQVNETGKRTGTLSVNTRYLVKGKAPNAEGVPPSAYGKNTDEAARNYKKMEDEAQRLGIRVLGLREFLDHVGYQAGERAVSLGAKANPEEFMPTLPGGVQRKPAKDIFKPRLPPTQLPKSPI